MDVGGERKFCKLMLGCSWTGYSRKQGDTRKGVGRSWFEGGVGIRKGSNVLKPVGQRQ